MATHPPGGRGPRRAWGTVDTGQAARVTVQEPGRRAAGMTGTAALSGESWIIAAMSRSHNRHHPPAIRHGLRHGRSQVGGGRRGGLSHARPKAARTHGTRSIDKSEICRLLTGVHEHRVMPTTSGRGRNRGRGRGEPQGDRVSSNMAGRGTDIRLGDGVYESAACTLSARKCVGRSAQLRGAARQGDPGTYRQFRPRRRTAPNRTSGEEGQKYRPGARARPAIAGCSRLLKGTTKGRTRHFRDRKALMYYEKQPKMQAKWPRPLHRHAS